MGPKVKVWVFLLLAGFACRLFPQQFIKTDASGGIFNQDQIISFELASPGWLRILLNERELYRGRGPAYQELGVPQGEERAFTLRAEYLTPGGDLAESLTWYIYIDKKTPLLPDLEFRNTLEGLRLIQTSGEPNIKIRALADIEGNLVFFRDLGNHLDLPTDFFPSESFPALIWAEDMAGNFSQFRSEFFDLSFVRIENPVPGEWLNQQILIISGAEGNSVYWTEDGSHPLEEGSAGRLYRGPVRIAKEGRVQIRIAWRETDGRVREDRVTYSVTPNRERTGRIEENLSYISKAEEAAVSSPLSIRLPGDWLWSVGNVPREQTEGLITFRPEPLIKRTAVLQLSAPGIPGVYRFAYLLDTGESMKERQIAVSNEPIIESYLYAKENRDAFPPLKLVTMGRNRVIVWPEVRGYIYYSWGGVWHEGKGPFPVPLHGGNLRWFVLDREIRENEEPPGPYSLSIASQPGMREPPRGRIAFRKYSGSQNWEYVSSLHNFTPGQIRNPGPDVCNGEDLVWAFISSGGRILEQQRRNRLSPPVPGIDGLPETGWTRGPVTLSINTGKEDYSGVIEAAIRYTSGIVAQKSGDFSLELSSELGERAEVTVEAYLTDSLGNRGPGARRHFTLDPKTIYVSSEPFVERPPAPSPENLGDPENPFTSLEAALARANAQGIAEIRAAGKLELPNPVTVARNLHIEGGWQWDGVKTEASVMLGNDFNWDMQNGAVLKLSGLRLERQRGDVSLIRAGRNGKVEITGSYIISQGPLLTMDAGVFTLNDSRMQLRIPGEQRLAAFFAGNSSVEVNDSRIELEGNYNLIFDIRGGSFFARESGFFAGRGKTASLIVLNGTKCNLNNLTLHAEAADYASSLEALGSEIVVSGGGIKVSARDTNAILLERCAAVILGTHLSVTGAFSARGVEIRGPFPVVQDCRFYSDGSAARSEVFSGIDIPKAGNVQGNLFSGFTHIWGSGWPIERLLFFNQNYASPEKPNTASLRP